MSRITKTEKQIIHDETSYWEFRNRLFKHLFLALLGFLIGFGFVMLTNSMSNSSMGTGFAIFIGILFAGMPYAWSSIPVVALGWVALLFKFFLALFLGWIITPIALGYNLIQFFRYKKKINK